MTVSSKRKSQTYSISIFKIKGPHQDLSDFLYSGNTNENQ